MIIDGGALGNSICLTIAQDEFHASILDRALNEIRRRSGVHRHNDSATQEDSPVTGNPLAELGPQEERDHLEQPRARLAHNSKREHARKALHTSVFPDGSRAFGRRHFAAKAGKFCE